MEEWGSLLGGRELSGPHRRDGVKGGGPEPGRGALTEDPGARELALKRFHPLL